MKTYTIKLVDNSIAEIKKVYKSNDFPFLIGFSGGKDSTLTVDLVLQALNELYIDSPKNIKKKTFIVSSDTLIENPFVVKRIDELENFIKSKVVDNLKIEFIRTSPSIEESFWTLIIGRGYPLPLNRFRWCTRHLKIRPTELAAYEIQNKYLSIVNVLGLRKNESASRSKKMDTSAMENEQYLFKNFEEERNVIFAPIKDFEIEDLWDYFLSKKYSFWNSNYNILYQMYQDSSKECVTANAMRVKAAKADMCGNSRWGCWICPLSNEIWIDNMYRNGIIDLKEVAEFRKELLQERDKLSNRYIGKHIKRRDGTYILGIRGLQKLKYNELINTYYKPSKGSSRKQEIIVVDDTLQEGYILFDKKNIPLLGKDILYNDEIGASSNLVFKDETDFYVLAPGPYTLKYRLSLLDRLIDLKILMQNKKINAGTEEAEIEIIRKDEFYLILQLIKKNATAISAEKLKSVNTKLLMLEKKWNQNLI